MTHRVLLAITELRPAGAERIVYELATRLPRERWHVRVCSLRSPGGDPGSVARALTEAGVEVVPIAMQGKLDPRGALRFFDAVRDFHPDVLHAHLFHANLAARLLGRPAGARRVVSTIHVVERRPLRLRRWAERLGAWRDDATVCVSEAVATHARRALGVTRDRLRVIPNGIDLTPFAALPDRLTARRILGLPPDRLLAGAVGRLTAQKGFDVLLEAFARMTVPGAHLVIAGDGEEAAPLRALAERLGIAPRVTFLGFHADVPRLLAALDAFCMPSRWEGFGLTLLEALAAGLPAVATNVDSLPEVAGDAALLVAPESPDALAAGLARVLCDSALRAELRRRGPEQARSCAVEPMVGAYEVLYEEIIKHLPNES